MNRFRILTTAALLAACSLSAATQNTSRQPSGNRGAVRGIVTRAGTGDPISGAQIRLFNPAALQRFVDFFNARGIAIAAPANGLTDEAFLQRVLATAAARGLSADGPDVQAAVAAFRATNDPRFAAISDATGSFSIDNVTPGTYTASAEREGYFGGTINNAANAAVVTTATVAAGMTADVAISMFQGATISGKVSLGGVPLVGATVQAFSITYQNGYQVLQPAVSKATDDRGEYRLFFLPQGEYLVAAQPRQVGRPVLITAGAPSAPSPDQQVRTFYPGTADSATAVSLAVKGSQEIVGIDIAVRSEKTYKVSGTVRSFVPISALRTQSLQLTRGAAPPAAPTVTAEVAFALHDPDVPDDLGGWTIGAIPLRLDANGFSGSFEVRGVLPGSYDWRAYVYEAPADGLLQPTTTIIPIDVRQDVSGLLFEIHQTVHVRGTVTIDGHAPGQTPVRVWLQVDGASAKRPGYQAIAGRIATANAQDGSFVIAGVQKGRFRLMPGNGLSPDLYIEEVRQSGQSVFDSGFVVGSDVPAPLQVMLRSGAGTIEGSVQDGSKKPVGGATVALIPSSALRQNRARYQAATSDATGRFTIRNIVPGDYRLFSWPDVPSGAYFNSRFLSRYEARGRAVSVTQSSTASMDLTALAPDN